MKTHSIGGQSLVSVLVAMGISSALMLSIFAVLEFANKSYASVKGKVSELQDTNNIIQLLASPKNCGPAFRDFENKPIVFNAQSPETVIDQIKHHRSRGSSMSHRGDWL